MREANQPLVAAALRDLGLGPGQNVLVHSAVQFLGRPVGGVGMYYAALSEVLAGGTLAVPTFTFAFARGEPYDPQASPSEGMGAFSEWVRQNPNARRTPHPMQSLAVIGPHALDLVGRDTPSAFDPGSAFERLLELDYHLLLLGANVDAASIIHYSEQRARVPYRYWKDFTGPVRSASGWEERTYRMYARDLELDPQLSLRPVQAVLEDRGQWQSVPFHYGAIHRTRLVDFVAAADELFARDPWALVTNKNK